MADSDPRYFDYSASKPPYLSALEIQRDTAVRYFANPSSAHRQGNLAKNKMAELKEDFCNLLNFQDGRLLICSSGTEANNLIIEGHMTINPSGRIILAENVHDSIWYAATRYKTRTSVTRPDQDGKISVGQLEKKISSDTSLVCISHVCNETGSVQDIERLTGFCHNRKIKILVDGVQAVGSIPVNMDFIYSDYYTFSAHKFGGPRSLGGVLLRDDKLAPLIAGGRQEWGLRAGTEHLSGLAGSVAALEISLKGLDNKILRLNYLKNNFIKALEAAKIDLLINSPANCLPGFISVSFPGYSGKEITAALSAEGFSVATGSACQDNITKPPRIIMAIGRNESQAKGTVRISMGRGNTELSVADLCESIIRYM
jgi:cysteine desulfurase